MVYSAAAAVAAVVVADRGAALVALGYSAGVFADLAAVVADADAAEAAAVDAVAVVARLGTASFR